MAQATGLGRMQKGESALMGHINTPEIPLQGTTECGKRTQAVYPFGRAAGRKPAKSS